MINNIKSQEIIYELYAQNIRLLEEIQHLNHIIGIYDEFKDTLSKKIDKLEYTNSELVKGYLDIYKQLQRKNKEDER